MALFGSNDLWNVVRMDIIVSSYPQPMDHAVQYTADDLYNTHIFLNSIITYATRVSKCRDATTGRRTHQLGLWLDTKQLLFSTSTMSRTLSSSSVDSLPSLGWAAYHCGGSSGVGPDVCQIMGPQGTRHRNVAI
ncbi:hypothetical protein OUZ56_031112 [Daphnia magna]|uniref:Uncharacterized protein n=1 Tax=Daphnia magna TaxID=35525 RepID=A0ABQ9ZTB2_9CRUS|nr:hypothetical protein OUZ56_031112 [Daphnia magna]